MGQEGPLGRSRGGAQLASSTSAKIGGTLDPSLRARHSPHLWPGQQRGDERPVWVLRLQARSIDVETGAHQGRVL